MRRRSTDFTVSPELRKAAEALGKSHEISLTRAMRKPGVRARLREQQYWLAMEEKRQQNDPSSS